VDEADEAPEDTAEEASVDVAEEAPDDMLDEAPGNMAEEADCASKLVAPLEAADEPLDDAGDVAPADVEASEDAPDEAGADENAPSDVAAEDAPEDCDRAIPETSDKVEAAGPKEVQGPEAILEGADEGESAVDDWPV
jgi:hypothetical protein